MNSLNNFNNELNDILESIKIFNEKYSNQFFAIELKKSEPEEIINHCERQVKYLNKITETEEINEIITETEVINEKEPEIITEITQENLQEFNEDTDNNNDEEIEGDVQSVLLELLDKIELAEFNKQDENLTEINDFFNHVFHNYTEFFDNIDVKQLFRRFKNDTGIKFLEFSKLLKGDNRFCIKRTQLNKQRCNRVLLNK